MTLVIKTTGIEDYLDAGSANIKCLIMGAPGAGKTRSASYWPKPILADCEKGRMAVADRKIPYAAVNSSSDMTALLRMLYLECQKPLDQRNYQTLIIDTLDSYQRIVIQERLDSEKKESLSGWADWGYLDGKMQQFVARLQALSMNVVVNLHIKDKQVSIGGDSDDDDAKINVSGPKLKGDLRDQIAAEFDLVGHMGTYWEAVDGERKMLRGVQWWPDPQHPILKDRSGQLPRWTPVTFTEEDHGALFGYLISHLDNLESSTDLQTLETDPQVTHEPAPPQAGGPVDAPLVPPTSTKPAAKKAAAPKPEPKPTEVVEAQQGPPVVAPPPAAAPPAAAAPPPAASTLPTDVGSSTPAEAQPPAATQPETPGASPAPEAAAPEAAAPAAEPVAEPSPSTDEAVATAQAALGGEVISDTPTAEASSTDAAPVSEPAATEQAVGTEASGQAAASGPAVCGTGTDALMPDEQPVQGCGKAIELEGPDAEPNPMLVEIAALKTRTNLCNACFTAYRAASS